MVAPLRTKLFPAVLKLFVTDHQPPFICKVPDELTRLPARLLVELAAAFSASEPTAEFRIVPSALIPEPNVNVFVLPAVVLRFVMELEGELPRIVPTCAKLSVRL